MAAYRRVYDSCHLHLTAKTGISSGTLRSVIEYGLPFYTGRGLRLPGTSVRWQQRLAARVAWAQGTMYQRGRDAHYRHLANATE